MHFFPPFNKNDVHLVLSKRELEEDGNVDIKMSPVLKSQEMNQTQFPQWTDPSWPEFNGIKPLLAEITES